MDQDGGYVKKRATPKPIQRMQICAAKTAGFDFHHDAVLRWNRVGDLLDGSLTISEKL
jgi:hypothetical protein